MLLRCFFIIFIVFAIISCDDSKKVLSNDKDNVSDEDILSGDEDSIPVTCGNGQIDTGEACDGESDIKNCTDINSTLYSSGKAKCFENCSGYDTITCTEIPHECGNKTPEGPEICDGGTKDCIEIDPSLYSGGKALCKGDCSGWDTITCEENSAVCGNNAVEGAELCDGSLDFCVDIDPSKFSGGKAYCLDDCSGWDTITCEEKVSGIDLTARDNSNE